MNKINYILIATAIILIFVIYRKTRKKTSDKWQILKINEMRNDSAGGGSFGASRGNRQHKGIDIIAEEGQNFFAPFDGFLTRTYNVYKSGLNYKGIEIKNESGLKVKIMYVNPDYSLIGKNVKKGAKLGTAANIKNRYTNSPTMQNHLHIEKWENGTPTDPYNNLF
jgi:murein DD-endopeptidase MepM/ murein hydrolase activator NlpD